MSDTKLERKNLFAAKRFWPDQLSRELVQSLRRISEELNLSVSSGEILLINQGWYVTHTGLLKIATRSGCCAIHVRPVLQFCNSSLNQWTFRAIVYRSSECKGFIGYGDANPTNISLVMRGSELRIAETRAVNRALRKAYGIGLCISEERTTPDLQDRQLSNRAASSPQLVAANGNGHHLRDRLLVLISGQKLCGALVKAYAADFCDVKELRDASKEQIQQFIQHLSEYATNDREGLLCQLNSYGPNRRVPHEAYDSGIVEDGRQGRGASWRGIPSRGGSRSVSLAETEALLLALLPCAPAGTTRWIAN